MSDEFTAFSNWVLTDFFFLLCGSSPFDRLRFIFFGGGGVCRVVARWLKVVTVDGVQAVVILIWLRNTD